MNVSSNETRSGHDRIETPKQIKVLVHYSCSLEGFPLTVHVGRRLGVSDDYTSWYASNVELL